MSLAKVGKKNSSDAGAVNEAAVKDSEAPFCWPLDETCRTFQFEKYINSVFKIATQFWNVRDARHHPDIATFYVLNALFHCAVLRYPSLNALEGNLTTSDFQKLIGFSPCPDEKIFSADTIANTLDVFNLNDLASVNRNVLKQSERNKVFREGWFNSLRFVALDGWEPFCSYNRHCPNCLDRKISKKDADGNIKEETQYYHRFVVAMMIDETMDLVVDFEPVLRNDKRPDATKSDTHEGELTAAKRLIRRVKTTYPWLDVMVGDAIYTNGPFLTLLKEIKMGAVLIAKKENQEPLKEALAIWGDSPPEKSVFDEKKKETIELWDVRNISMLDSYKGNIRVVRGKIKKETAKSSTTWCMAVTGKAESLSAANVLAIARARWHIENTGFHQWVCHWNLNHVFRHTDNALRAILLIWMLAFNLLQLFLYRRLKRNRCPDDPWNTIRHFVEVMAREIATISQPVPWIEFYNTA
jgi:hypothetical protein